jgi:hypothetical protein
MGDGFVKGCKIANSNFTFTTLLQALHGSKSKFTLQKYKNRYEVFFRTVFRHFLPACLS